MDRVIRLLIMEREARVNGSSDELLSVRAWYDWLRVLYHDRLLHHRRDQMFQRGCGIATSAGVDGRGLDHRAARRDQPFEASPLR